MSLDRVKKNLDAFVQAVFPKIDFMALYPCKVVAQNPDGTLELIPDNKALAGLSKVPIAYGLPGVDALVVGVARAYLGFRNGDPGQPYAALWEPGATLLSLRLGGATAVDAMLKGTSYVAAETALNAVLSALSVAIGAFAAATGAFATATGAALPPTLATATALTTAAGGLSTATSALVAAIAPAWTTAATASLSLIVKTE